MQAVFSGGAGNLLTQGCPGSTQLLSRSVGAHAGLQPQSSPDRRRAACLPARTTALRRTPCWHQCSTVAVQQVGNTTTPASQPAGTSAGTSAASAATPQHQPPPSAHPHIQVDAAHSARRCLAQLVLRVACECEGESRRRAGRHSGRACSTQQVELPGALHAAHPPAALLPRGVQLRPNRSAASAPM